MRFGGFIFWSIATVFARDSVSAVVLRVTYKPYTYLAYPLQPYICLAYCSIFKLIKMVPLYTPDDF